MHKDTTQIPELERLYGLLNFALEHFRSCVIDKEETERKGVTLEDSLGVSRETIDRYQVGYAMNSWSLLKNAGRKATQAYTLKEMEHAGLLHGSVKRRKEHYDLFRGRIMVPFLHPETGQCIGFAGRLLVNDASQPMDLFSHNVWLFSLRDKVTVFRKDHYLFGLYQAMKSIRDQNVVYVMWDYLDVLRLADAGITNSVSSSGIPFTLNQAMQLRALADHVVLVYSGERPGMRAAKHKVDVFLAAGMKLKIVVLENKIKELRDPVALRTMLSEKREDYVVFKAKHLLKGIHAEPSEVEKELKSIVRTIGFIPVPLTRELYLQQCAAIANLPVDMLRNVLHAVDTKRQQEIEASKKKKGTGNSVKSPVATAPVQDIDLFNKLTVEQQTELELVRLLLRHNERPLRGELFVDRVLREVGRTNIEISEPVLLELYGVVFELRAQGIVPSKDHFKSVDQVIGNAARSILFPAFSVRELLPSSGTKSSPLTIGVNRLKEYLLTVKLEELQKKMEMPDSNPTDKEKFERFEASYQRALNLHRKDRR